MPSVKQFTGSVPPSASCTPWLFPFYDLLPLESRNHPPFHSFNPSVCLSPFPRLHFCGPPFVLSALFSSPPPQLMLGLVLASFFPHFLTVSTFQSFDHPRADLPLYLDRKPFPLGRVNGLPFFTKNPPLLRILPSLPCFSFGYAGPLPLRSWFLLDSQVFPICMQFPPQPKIPW